MKILLSPGFGAGWSTWAGEHSEFMLKDPGLIALAEAEADTDAVTSYLKSKGMGNIYTGGWDDICVFEVKPGTRFRVTEYDGSEGVELYDANDYMVAG